MSILSVLLDICLQTLLDTKRIGLRWVKRHGQANSILSTVFCYSSILVTVGDGLLPTCVDEKSNQVGPHVVATLKDVSVLCNRVRSNLVDIEGVPDQLKLC